MAAKGEFQANGFSKALASLLRLHAYSFTELSVPRGQPWLWDSWPAFELAFVVCSSKLCGKLCLHIHAHMQKARARHPVSFSVASHLISLSQGLSLTLKLIVWASCLASEPWGATCLYSLSLRSQAQAVMPDLLCGYWRFELKASHLQGKCSYPRSHFPSHESQICTHTAYVTVKKRKSSFENLSTQRKGLIPRLLWINSVKSSTVNNLGPTFFLYGKFTPYLIFHYSFWHPSSDQNEDAKAWLALPPLPVLSPGSEVLARFPCTHTMLTLWSGADEVPKFVVPT